MSSPAPFAEVPAGDAGGAPAALPLAAEAPAAALVARGVSKFYRGGDGGLLHVLDGVDFSIARGEAVSVIGRGGWGKSTLLQVRGGLDEPNSGEVWIGGEPLHRLREEALARLRSEKIGFVFQFHHLLREFTALENVMMPQLIRGVEAAAARERARSLLAGVGLGGRARHKTAQPPGGGGPRRRARGRALCWGGGGGGRAPATSRPSFRGASSSAWRWRGRLPTARWCCWPTSPPATSTPRPPRRCTTSSSASAATRA